MATLKLCARPGCTFPRRRDTRPHSRYRYQTRESPEKEVPGIFTRPKVAA
jgi:hypothetical protein